MSFRNKRGKLIIEDNDYFTYWNSLCLYIRESYMYGIPFTPTSPHFLDIGIMGNCSNNCRNCYMQNYKNNNHMPFKTFKKIIDDNKNLLQISLGGAGNSIEHPEIEKMIEYARKKEIIVNTTINIPKNVSDKQYEIINSFDAVGLSTFDFNSTKNIMNFLSKINECEMKCKFVLHVVVGNNLYNNIIKNIYETKISDILFLAYKENKKIISDPRKKWEYNGNFVFKNDNQQKDFNKLLSVLRHYCTIGVDSCLAPYIMPDIFEPNIPLDICDSGIWSAYISPEGKYHKCSCYQDKGEKSWVELYNQDYSECDFINSFGSKRKINQPILTCKLGYMTNSSSSSYMVFSNKDKDLKLPVISIDKYFRQTRPFANMYDKDNYNLKDFYNDNKVLIKCSLNDWGAYVANSVFNDIINKDCNYYQNFYDLNKLTKEILDKKLNIYYLVSDRDDIEGKTYFSKEDISDKDIIFIRASVEH